MKFWRRLFLILLALVGLSFLIKKGVESWTGSATRTVLVRQSVLHLDLKGIILNGKKFLENLKEYREEKNVKAIIVEVNSPGGAVGPSQELFSELRRTRDEFQKPIVCYTSGIMASGGYYAALGCDKIVVAPGALIGSIGVIMSFANLEGLYDWAKISRYSITSGKFKDSGAEYRPMREDEKKLFQSMIDEVYLQFKTTVKESRPQIKGELLEEYTDGRVFTGQKAVETGFADAVGTYDQAVQIAADLAGLKEDQYDIFEIPKHRRSIWEWGSEEEDDTINSLLQNGIQKSLKQLFGLELLNQPVYLMPGVWVD
ncbi:MAG: signal peptide peptidase SppA [Bdellovibrionales bacterium]